MVTEYSSTTSRAVIQHDLSPDSNVYASLSEGFKAGGYATYECTDPYDPEEVTSLEFGYKGSLAENTSLNASLFRYDYTDFQVLQVVGIQTVTRNAGDATVNGLEIEATAQFGQYLYSEKLLKMTGAVLISSSSGYNLSSPELRISTDGTYIFGEGPIEGLSPMGKINAGKMEIMRKNAKAPMQLWFGGKVVLDYEPSEI